MDKILVTDVLQTYPAGSIFSRFLEVSDEHFSRKGIMHAPYCPEFHESENQKVIRYHNSEGDLNNRAPLTILKSNACEIHIKDCGKQSARESIIRLSALEDIPGKGQRAILTVVNTTVIEDMTSTGTSSTNLIQDGKIIFGEKQGKDFSIALSEMLDRCLHTERGLYPASHFKA